MAPPDNIDLARIRAANMAEGAQYLKDGDGDQNVAGGTGTLIKIGGHLIIMGGQPGSGMPPMSHLEQWLKEPKNWTQGSLGRGLPDQPEVNASGNETTTTFGYADMIDWLKRQPDQTPLDLRKHHIKLLGQVTEGTGKWVLQTDQFRSWKDASSPSRLLCMHGNLGSGKTMLVSLIVDWLEKKVEGRDDAACVYFYFQGGGQHHVPLSRVWTTLLSQLLARESGEIASDLKAKFSSLLQRSTELSSAEFVALFEAQASRFKTVYMVIDALDTCQDVPGERTQQRMHNALKGLPENVRLLFTSRDERICQSVGAYQTLRIQPQKQDVRTYVRKRIEDDYRLSCALGGTRAKNDVITQVTNLALDNGMFLLALLHMDDLSKRGTLGSIKEAMQKLPDGARAVFDASAEVIAEKAGHGSFEGRLSKHVLTWVIHAKEELNLEQIRDSFAVQESMGKPFREHRPAEELLLSSCNGLVVMDPDKGTLNLVHESVRACLEERGITPANADVQMAKSCLLYLLADDGGREGEPAFFAYAAKYWPAHLGCKGQQPDAETEDLALRFLSDSAKLAEAFGAMAGTESGLFEHMTGLHAAAHFGLSSLADRLFKSHPHVDVNTRCAGGQTALHWAVRYGRRELLELLLRKSADPGISDDVGDTPLHKALEGPTPDGTPLHLATTRSAGDGLGVVEALVKGKAPLYAKNRRGVSPLLSAIRYGPTNMALVMIQGQDDVNAVVDSNLTSLQLVFYHGWDVVHALGGGGPAAVGGPEGWAQVKSAVGNHCRLLTDALLARGVDLNRPWRESGWTPLAYAAMHGEMTKLRQLLGREPDPANVNQRDGEGKSPLWWAVTYNASKAARLLVDHGADVNETYNGGTTPLIEAVKLNNEKCVWVLLSAGARPGTRDRDGWSALVHAVDKKYNKLAWLLLTFEASATGPSRNRNIGGSEHMSKALELAIDRDDLPTAWLLSEHGASADAVDSKGMTPLHRAAKSGRPKTVRFLVDRGAAVNVRDQTGSTPLHHAVLAARDDVVTSLAAGLQGPVLDVPDANGNTALVLATLKGQLNNVRALLSLGASCKVANPKGLTALHHAARMGFHEGLRLLLENGADANVVDKQLFTPLHHLVNNGKANQQASLNTLARAGASLEARDRHGRTPLMLAAQLCRKTMVQWLLDMGADRLARLEDGSVAANLTADHGIKQMLRQWPPNSDGGRYVTPVYR